MDDPATLWNRHLIVVENDRQFVDSHILDVVSESKINNRQRDIGNAVSQVVNGSGLDPKDMIRTIQTSRSPKASIFVAVSS